jgi:hypothetical protein
VESARRWLIGFALAGIAAGAFQPFYLTVWRQDWRALGAFLTEVPYRKVPGLRRACLEAERRVPLNASVMLVTNHPSWPKGYDYAFRRAHYLLAGRQMVPMLGPRPAAPPDFILCVPANCTAPLSYRAVWRDASGALLERQ